jgi:hypothetical protein
LHLDGPSRRSDPDFIAVVTTAFKLIYAVGNDGHFTGAPEEVECAAKNGSAFGFPDGGYPESL